jgi:hypothetical protein
MTPIRIVVPAIALFLFAAGLGTAKASGQSHAQPTSAPVSAPLSVQAQNHNVDPDAWDTPPEGLQEIQLKGFRDGIVGARKDFGKHREPDVNDREEYRNPHISSVQADAYRDGFTRGYERGASHLIAGPDQPVIQLERPVSEPARNGPYVRAEAGHGQGDEIQRRGFQDGMARARKDLDNHHKPAVNARDESRQLKLTPELRLEYLVAFSQGYDHFTSEQAGGPLLSH